MQTFAHHKFGSWRAAHSDTVIHCTDKLDCTLNLFSNTHASFTTSCTENIQIFSSLL